MNKQLGEMAGMLLVAVAKIATLAFALVHIWAWFLIPAFGLPPMPAKAAVGLVLLLGVLRVRSRDAKEEIDFADHLVMIAAAWLGIGIAWIVQGVMA